MIFTREPFLLSSDLFRRNLLRIWIFEIFPYPKLDLVLVRMEFVGGGGGSDG